MRYQLRTFLLFGLVTLLGCKASTENLNTTIRASGSSALQPLVNLAKEQFEGEHRHIDIEVSAGGSRKGLVDVSSGIVDIGNSDIPAPDDLKGELVDHAIAVIPFAIVANKGSFNENVSKIRLKELARVFRKETTDWRELGGEAQPIVLINRAVGSGTRSVVGQAVLGGDDFAEARTEDNSGALVAKLKQTKGALSYLALSFVDDELLTLAIETDNGVFMPNADAIRSGDYPLWSHAHMYTRGEPTGGVKLFLDYLLSPQFQREALPKLQGFLPVIDIEGAKGAR